MLDYLQQYDYIFELELEEYSNAFPVPYIWQCWLQGRAKVPPLVEACLRSVHNYHGQRKIKFVDGESIHDFITIPHIIQNKYERGAMAPAHYSDYIRVALLAKYGGTWLDATIFLTDSMPSEIFSQEFFAYVFPAWCDAKELPALELVFSEQTSAINKRCFSNWCMHAKCNNRLIKLLRIFLEEYWKKEDVALDYYMFHLFSSYIVLKDPLCQNMFRSMLQLSNAYPHLLQQCLTKAFDENLYNTIKELTTLHKLTYKLDSEILPHSFTSHICSEI